MILYAAMTALSVLLATIATRRSDAHPNRPSVLFSILSFLPLTLISLFRVNIGTDWPIYESFFNTINTGGETFFEPLFNLLNRFVYLFSGDFQVFIIVIAVLIGIFTYLAIYQQSVNIPLSILFFVLSGFFFNSMNQIRQALAMAVFIFAFKYIFDRKALKYFIWTIAAALIHTSAVVFIPLYFLYNRKVSLRFQAIMLVGFAALLPLLSKLTVFLVNQTRYSWYFDSMHDLNNFYLAGFVFHLVLLGIHIYYYYKSDIVDPQYNVMVNMQFLALLMILFTASIPQIYRISNCFSIVIYLSIPKMLRRESNRNVRIMLGIFLVLIFTAKLLYDSYVNTWWYHVVPYQWIFS